MVNEEEFKKKEGESGKEYRLRVSSLGLDMGLTWREITTILNEELGLHLDVSTYRKRYKEMITNRCNAEAEKEAEENGDLQFSKEEQLWRERYALSSGKLGYYRLLRQDSRFTRFYKVIAESIRRLEPPALKITKCVPEKNRHYVMTLADLHIGACFESVNNKYSVEIAQARLEKLLSKTIGFVQEKKISTLSIISLGDIIQGILRISDLKLNEMAVIDAFVVAMRLVAEFLNQLSAYVKVDFYQVCYSNHDQMRPLGTKASELGAEDMGKILFAYLTDVLDKNKRIKVIGDTGHDYLEFKIFDFNCIALHGHQVKSAHDVYKNLANRHHKFYDYIFLGHTHSLKTFVNAECSTYDAETLVSSSFVGSDPYADSLMVGSKASVLLHEFAPIEGRVASYKIILN